MTGFGVYLVIVYVLSIASALYYLGRGGYTVTPRILVFSTIWAVFNLFGVLFFGTGFGI